jgi:trimeric autotransporter adhesin
MADQIGWNSVMREQYIDDSDYLEFSNLTGSQTAGASHGHHVFINTQSLNGVTVSNNGSITFSYADHQVQGFVQQGGDLMILHDVRTSGASGTLEHVVEDRYFYAICFSGCTTTPDPALYSLGGEVAGLNGNLVLSVNGVAQPAISSSGVFTFTTPLFYGQAYTVAIETQPGSQNCTLANASGVATNDVTNVVVTCSNQYAIGGTVTGLAGTLGLRLNGSESLSVTSNGPFAFTTPINQDDSYAVEITSQPSGQVCTLANGSGAATANVTNVAVSCVSQFGISGALSGLASGTIDVTLNSGLETLSLSNNGGFSFTSTVNNGDAYSVSISSTPANHDCSVTNGSGTAAGAVTNVQVNCVALFRVGGSVNGLAGSVTLQINGSETIVVAANASFVFPSLLNSGTSYTVTVQSQPAGQECTVGNASGTATANVSNVTVDCVNL